MRYTIKHVLDTGVDSFWNRLFFDADFNRWLFVEALGFSVYNVLEDRKEPSGVAHRRVECVPKIELPAAARKVFGETIGYTEIGRFDPATRRYSIEVVPKVGADKVKTKSELWVVPHGDKRCERIVTVDNTVKVFGLGTLLEGFIEQQTRDQYGKAAEATNRYIREHGI